MSLSRRRFIQNTIGGMAVLGLPTDLIKNSDRLFAASEPAQKNLQFFLDHFTVSQEMIRKVMTEALRLGGDYCDLYFQHNISNYIGLEDKQVNRAYTTIEFGVGVRVLQGDQTGYSFSEEISLPTMISAARAAAAIASGSSKQRIKPFQVIDTPNYYAIKTPWEKVSVKEKIPFLQKLNDITFARDPRLVKVNVGFGDDTSYILIATSEGRIAHDLQPMTYVNVSCIAEEKGKKEQNYAGISQREGIDLFTPAVLEKIAKDAAERTVTLFQAVKPKAGEMPVVLAPGSSGILLHEAIGHGMEADFNRKKTSIFSDKIGKEVAGPHVSIVDDGTTPFLRGTLNIDDEATQSQRTFLVENGILKGYLHDRVSANHYQIASTGNGRRESFRFAPIPRMRNTCLLPGPHTPAEIIASVPYGIYAETFTNGEVYIGAGDFTFYVKSGYLIENGQITSPIKDINIIGNGFEVLKRMVMVGNDFAYAEGTWTCGKDGQSVPVSMGLPTVKVAAITVGGVS